MGIVKNNCGFCDLHLIFDLHWKELTVSDTEGLYALKTLLNCKQVKEKDIRKNYYAADHFSDKLTDGFLMTLCDRKVTPLQGYGTKLDIIEGMTLYATTHLYYALCSEPKV